MESGPPVHPPNSVCEQLEEMQWLYNHCTARCDKVHDCTFAESGFNLNGTTFPASGVRYHSGCICVGEPFTTRLPDGRTVIPLRFMVHAFHLWIVYNKTVQANLDRLLQCDNSQDISDFFV